VPPLWIDHSLWILNGSLRLLSKERSLSPRNGGAEGQEQSIVVSNTVDDIFLRLQEALALAPHGNLRMDGLHIHVGSPWVRYGIVPWQDGLKNNADWSAYARIVLGQQFDTDAQGWHVCVAAGGYGAPRVAASIDEVLYQTTVSFAKSQRLQIRQFDTALASTVDMFSGRLSAAEFALLVLESKYASYAIYRDAEWQGVGSFPIAHERPNGVQLAAVLRDAAMLSSSALPSQVYLSSYGQLPVDLQGMTGFTLHWLGLSFPMNKVPGQAAS